MWTVSSFPNVAAAAPAADAATLSPALQEVNLRTRIRNFLNSQEADAKTNNASLTEICSFVGQMAAGKSLNLSAQVCWKNYFHHHKTKVSSDRHFVVLQAIVSSFQNQAPLLCAWQKAFTHNVGDTTVRKLADSDFVACLSVEQARAMKTQLGQNFNARVVSRISGCTRISFAERTQRIAALSPPEALAVGAAVSVEESCMLAKPLLDSATDQALLLPPHIAVVPPETHTVVDALSVIFSRCCYRMPTLGLDVTFAQQWPVRHIAPLFGSLDGQLPAWSAQAEHAVSSDELSTAFMQSFAMEGKPEKLTHAFPAYFRTMPAMSKRINPNAPAPLERAWTGVLTCVPNSAVVAIAADAIHTGDLPPETQSLLLGHMVTPLPRKKTYVAEMSEEGVHTAISESRKNVQDVIQAAFPANFLNELRAVVINYYLPENLKPAQKPASDIAGMPKASEI